MTKWYYKWKPIEDFSKEELIDIILEMRAYQEGRDLEYKLQKNVQDYINNL